METTGIPGQIVALIAHVARLGATRRQPLERFAQKCVPRPGARQTGAPPDEGGLTKGRRAGCGLSRKATQEVFLLNARARPASPCRDARFGSGPDPSGRRGSH